MLVLIAGRSDHHGVRIVDQLTRDEGNRLESFEISPDNQIENLFAHIFAGTFVVHRVLLVEPQFFENGEEFFDALAFLRNN